MSLIEPGILSITCRYAGALFYTVLVLSVVMRRTTAAVSLGGGNEIISLKRRGVFVDTATLRKMCRTAFF
jgi:hypothetical protein